MTPTRTLAVFATLLIATAALAHEGVQNPTVIMRMHLMKNIGASTKVIGDMAKGKVPFDAEAAQAAAAALEEHAAKIEAAFEEKADDPKSEALPAIWKDFAGFTDIAAEMGEAARLAGQGLASETDLRPALQRIGKTCADCHELYRK